MTRTPLALTDAAKGILAALGATEAARLLVRHVADTRNGMAIIDAVRSLNARGEKRSKESLKLELEVIGMQGLSNATTDHATLLN